MKTLLPTALAGLLSAHLSAADLQVSLEIPRLNVAEYHRPYVAIWVEKPDQSVVGTLSVLYEQQPKKTDPGTTWLKDLRQWWRRTGRELQMPMDGVSGATRAPGVHTMSFPAAKGALAKLQPGSYQLVVEAAREVGGRELVRIPFQWPAAKSQPAEAQGQHELGKVTLNVRP
jgi:hypothetical protein